MIIYGIGIDIINVNRIKKSIIARPFAQKILSPFEYENTEEKLFSEPLYMSFVFSAKEAVSKAIGTGFVGISFKDITVCFDDKCPYAIVNVTNPNICDYKYYLNIEHISSNIDVDSPMIIATCIAYKQENDEESICDLIKNKRYAYLVNARTTDLDNFDLEKLNDTEMCFNHQGRAANIAAKEALFKLHSMDLTNRNYKKLSILRDKSGKPYFETTNKELLKRINKYHTYLSLSHEKELAVAYVLLQTKE